MRPARPAPTGRADASTADAGTGSDARRSIAEFLDACAAGSDSAVSATQRCLARIAAHDRTGMAVAAMLSTLPDAIDRARACDRARSAGSAADRPLLGVPIVVKDNIDVVSVPTTSGAIALKDATPLRSASAVAALHRAGAVLIGKTNLSEFSFEIRSRSSLGGDTRNPFAPHVTSGGSSGGTAVAVAGGFALAGIGTDTGGSIRIPAAYNGLVGLRPTLGSISTRGVAPLAPSTDTVGPIARCVADAALLFRVLAPDLHAAGPACSTLRVGVVRQLYGIVPDIARAMDAAISALRDAGVAVADAQPLPPAAIPSGEHIVDEEFGPAFDRYLRDNFVPASVPQSLDVLIGGGQFLPEYKTVLRARARPRDPAVRAAIKRRHLDLRTALDACMARGGFDALLYPPSAVLPVSMANPKGGWAAELAACAGWPAIVVPVGAADNGLPLSVELLGRAGAEPTLFTLGQAIEDRVPKRPVPELR
jgi:Asp-tRNA(Asn)/Glu-tRNA(Gln) amidotransferase A subunit family amidase